MCSIGAKLNNIVSSIIQELGYTVIFVTSPSLQIKLDPSCLYFLTEFQFLAEDFTSFLAAEFVTELPRLCLGGHPAHFGLLAELPSLGGGLKCSC